MSQEERQQLHELLDLILLALILMCQEEGWLEEEEAPGGLNL